MKIKQMVLLDFFGKKTIEIDGEVVKYHYKNLLGQYFEEFPINQLGPRIPEVRVADPHFKRIKMFFFCIAIVIGLTAKIADNTTSFGVYFWVSILIAFIFQLLEFIKRRVVTFSNKEAKQLFTLQLNTHEAEQFSKTIQQIIQENMGGTSESLNTEGRSFEVEEYNLPDYLGKNKITLEGEILSYTHKSIFIDYHEKHNLNIVKRFNDSLASNKHWKNIIALFAYLIILLFIYGYLTHYSINLFVAIGVCVIPLSIAIHLRYQKKRYVSFYDASDSYLFALFPNNPEKIEFVDYLKTIMKGSSASV